jgi:hypothetical protein
VAGGAAALDLAVRRERVANDARPCDRLSGAAIDCGERLTASCAGNTVIPFLGVPTISQTQRFNSRRLPAVRSRAASAYPWSSTQGSPRHVDAGIMRVKRYAGAWPVARPVTPVHARFHGAQRRLSECRRSGKLLRGVRHGRQWSGASPVRVQGAGEQLLAISTLRGCNKTLPLATATMNPCTAGFRQRVRCLQNGWKGGEPYRGCVSRVKRGYT